MSNVTELPGASAQSEPANTQNPTSSSQQPKAPSRRRATPKAPAEEQTTASSAPQQANGSAGSSRSRSRRSNSSGQNSANGTANAAPSDNTSSAPQQPGNTNSANNVNNTNNSSRSRSRRSNSSGQHSTNSTANSAASEQHAAPANQRSGEPNVRSADHAHRPTEHVHRSPDHTHRQGGNEGQAHNAQGQRYTPHNRLTSDQRLGNASGRNQPRQGNGYNQNRGQGNGAPQNRPYQHSPNQHRPPQSGTAPARPGQPESATVYRSHSYGPAQHRSPQNSTATYSSTSTQTGSTTTSRPSGPGRPGGGRPRSGAGRPGGRSNGRGSSRPGGGRGTSRRGSNQTQERRMAAPVKEKPTGPISLPPQMIVKDLAGLLDISPVELIRTLIKHGIFANINEVVDYEKAALVAQDIGYEPTPLTSEKAPADGRERQLSASDAMIASRKRGQTIEVPPVVTIMGHVDHGKTSLLDMIRKTKVAASEAGGITQHIGAYQVEVNNKKITFLDTPGHEAFTAMRARGAHVTHIAIIVVAADDGIMPQTVEAIDHAKAANVPILIALNKIDKPNANPDRVKQQLAEIGILIEEYGGETICVPVSAKKAIGIDELLDYILLVAEMQDIQANPNGPANGVILEAKLEKSAGVTASVLVQQGTLKMGDCIVVGSISGKVRAMFNDRGKRIQKAPPSTPVSILGLPEVPQAGDRLQVVADDKTAKTQAQQVATKRREEATPLGQVSLDTLYMQMQEGKVKELNVILKTDVQGSSEAIKGSLSKLGEENMKVRLIHEGVGTISETDVHLAAASGAIVIGFHVKADGAAMREAQKEGVDIRYYEVIYKLIDDIQAALVGMLEPTYREVIDGHAEVVQTFKAGRSTVIAGCRVIDGKITRSSQARILRKKEQVFEGKVASLRRGKDDVREVASGYECGIVFEDFTGFEAGDIIEAFSQERVMPGKG